MSLDVLYDPSLMPHLTIDGLNRYHDRPCLLLGDNVITYAEMRAMVSQLIQALAARGVGRGSRVAYISGNRPEVLANIAAMQIAGCVGTPLHPMGSLDDHAYVLEDAGIEALIFDPTLFEHRARELQERVPAVRHLLSFGPTEVGEDYPDVEVAYQHIDAATIHMVTDPGRFDVIVTDNLFGDIITDLAAAVSGGIGLAASGNIDATRTNPSMFEPVHGSAPDIAGKGIADPTAAVMSVALLLSHLGEDAAAARVDKAVADHLATRGGTALSTAAVGARIRDRL